jgi:2,5-diamino-6-(ribosylamino)-4(3H)-pyrimidinone 5'-phosphate reductase
MEKSRPKVILNAAISIDGKIATINDDSKLSSLKDIRRVHKLRSKIDAIIIGKNTLENDDPLLTVRYVSGKNPVRIIFDSRGRISLKSKIIKTASKVPTIIVSTEKISKKNRLLREKNSAKVIVSGKNIIDVKKLVHELSKHKIKSVLLEGGGITNWEFFKQGIVDEIIVTVTPYILGGKNAVTLVEGKGFKKILHSSKFKLKKTNRLGSEIVLHYTKL